jgi:hypothetical protein
MPDLEYVTISRACHFSMLEFVVFVYQLSSTPPYEREILSRNSNGC